MEVSAALTVRLGGESVIIQVGNLNYEACRWVLSEDSSLVVTNLLLRMHLRVALWNWEVVQ